jgi:hypothetical protein
MIASRWFLLVPLALFALACSEKADDGGANGGTGNPSGGTGNPTGGVSGAAGTAGSVTGGAGGTSGAAGAGATANGGSAGSGVSGAAGSSVSGTGGSDMGGTGGTGPSVTCTITPTSSTSTRIPTVGIVTFTTDLAGMSEAHIDFGRDTNYGMTAPVDLAATDHRTLLLGMKPSNMYHYRVVASSPSGQCTGTDNTVMTGARATGLPTLDIMTNNAAALAGGFLVTGQYQGSGSGGMAPAYILDADGDIVWWFMIAGNVTGARMSYDGKFMWINSANVPESQGAVVHKVSMDGMSDENLSSSFTGMNHQLTVLPDETIVFYAYNSSITCEDIKERSPTGTVRTIVNSLTAQGLTRADCSTMPCCHVNMVEYSAEDDTVVFSDLDHNSYTKVRRNGEVVWVLGGTTSDFTGTAQTWSRQHGIDVLGLNRFLFFNNGNATSGSVAIEILLDLTAMTTTRPWTYTAMPTIPNQVMGDVQRLDNGNTIVAYSTQGVLHEVNATGQLLQEINWPLGGAFGYIQKRKTLYGAPPR